MKPSSMISPLAVAGCLLCASAIAQTRVCLGGDLGHLTPAQKTACSADIQAVRSLAAAMHAPDGWHFVVVCGEESWKQYAAYTMRDDQSLLSAAADTNFATRETFLRESRPDQGGQMSLKSVLAREVAGIVSHNIQRASVDAELSMRTSRQGSREAF